jgi:hypothetical protein
MTLPPDVPELAALSAMRLSPHQLLSKLSQCGVHLLPEDRDCIYVELDAKETALEAGGLLKTSTRLTLNLLLLLSAAV